VSVAHPVSVIPDDFFTDVPGVDPWGAPDSPRRQFNVQLVKALRAGPPEGRMDPEVAIALAGLIHDELQAYGTGGGETLTDAQMTEALSSLRAVVRRVGGTFEPPFRNFTTFRSWWLRQGASHSWQARRDLLEELLGPLHLELARIEERTLDALAEPITPHAELGWPLVDAEIRELRRRFQTASSPQDYRALGTNCVGVLEALGQVVYDPTIHLREGETVPPRDKTKQRIGRYIEDALGGQANESVRGLMNKAVELAHHVKHSPTGTRRDAGIAADAVIMLSNMLRRLDQEI
jgi:hypothetical protein